MINIRWNGLPIIIFGSGGISKEIYFLVEEINRCNKSRVFDVVGFIEEHELKIGKTVINDVSVVACDNNFEELCKDYKVLGVVVPIGSPRIKELIVRKINNIDNLVFPNIIHPNVEYDYSNFNIGEGNILTSGTKITTDVIIGNFNLVNLNSTIGHDTVIGDFNVINPLSSISGNVKIGNCCLIGTGTNILQQIKVGDNSTIGAGSVVTKNVPKNETVVGIPAKKLEKT
ncbi:NeuD/PglB/VioB family sugar acetyltransferase [Lutibacter sp. B2]|nr:NeuD/PglB/VioB family sugar acetyltransferase [Lutibacter sp. B2]